MERKRFKIIIHGAVQGVGFRPFVYQLAVGMGFSGWVCNTSHGALIEIEGPEEKLDSFLTRLEKEKPAQSFITSMEYSVLDVCGYMDFEIRESQAGEKTALIMPDIATCPECLKEIFDPSNRRYLYPFTNCTHCGPRYSIMLSIPYDRKTTTMRDFTMCEDCEREYRDPSNRRFHAQPNACPVCGPRMKLFDRDRRTLKEEHDAIREAVRLLKDGAIIALKGLGGFQLLVDAHNNDAVQVLRERKRRGPKPFALMYPDLTSVKNDAKVSIAEERLLLSSEAPIVILKRSGKDALTATVAPENPYLGIMLPYTPLHHILLKLLKGPLVATSGNRSEEPICIDNDEAFGDLKDIADFFLVHDRSIARHVDDSIARVMAGRQMVLRRARGYAPLPINIHENAQSILALGPHLKNTIALTSGERCFISQHIGDLESRKSLMSFEKTIADIQEMYEIQPEIIACDLHPTYMSTVFAKDHYPQPLGIQHHMAHIFSCMTENEIKPPVMGVAWDGTGFGLDDNIWGGEFFIVEDTGVTRFAHFTYFPLPGGEQAIKEPRLAAIGYLWAQCGKGALKMNSLAPLKSLQKHELAILETMLEKGINCPLTSSVGRLFDVVSSLLNICHENQFEGQAAMAIEFAAENVKTDDKYSFSVHSASVKDEALKTPLIITGPAILEILEDINKEVNREFIAAKFHNTLVDIIVHVARLSAQSKIVLSGGCFQNKYLLERTVSQLRDQGIRVYWHQRVPTNDGGIALGQITGAKRMLNKS